MGTEYIHIEHVLFVNSNKNYTHPTWWVPKPQSAVAAVPLYHRSSEEKDELGPHTTSQTSPYLTNCWALSHLILPTSASHPPLHL